MQTAIFIVAATINAENTETARHNNLCELGELGELCLVRRDSSVVSLEEERRVRAAEPERVRQRVLHRHRALLVRYVIEVALLVRMLEVDRGRHELMMHGERRDAGLEPAGGAEKVPGH